MHRTDGESRHPPAIPESSRPPLGVSRRSAHPPTPGRLKFRAPQATRAAADTPLHHTGRMIMMAAPNSSSTITNVQPLSQRRAPPPHAAPRARRVSAGIIPTAQAAIAPNSALNPSPTNVGLNRQEFVNADPGPLASSRPSAGPTNQRLTARRRPPWLAAGDPLVARVARMLMTSEPATRRPPSSRRTRTEPSRSSRARWSTLAIRRSCGFGCWTGPRIPSGSPCPLSV